MNNAYTNFLIVIQINVYMLSLYALSLSLFGVFLKGAKLPSLFHEIPYITYARAHTTDYVPLNVNLIGPVEQLFKL